MTGPEAVAYTSAEVAEALGVGEATVRRFWRALGLPYAGDAPAYTPADVATLRALLDAVGDDVDLETAIRLVRPLGQNVARMSDWQVAAMGSRAGELAAGSPGQGRVEVSRKIADEMADALGVALLHTWRRHLSAALARLESEHREEHDPAGSADLTSDVATVTVGFADLVKFSAMSNEIEVNRLGELVEIFESRSGDVVAAHEGRLIKTLGDSVLFIADGAESAVRIALGIIDVIGGDVRLPDVRIGLASGEIVTRMGDVFGPPVNLAARLTAVARRNRVLVDQATAAALPGEKFLTSPLSARPLRGFGVVQPVAVRRA